MAFSYHTWIMRMLSGVISQVLHHRWNNCSVFKIASQRRLLKQKWHQLRPWHCCGGSCCMRGVSVIDVVLCKGKIPEHFDVFHSKTRRCVSVYLGVVVLRVWYFEHALLQLKNCHYISPEKTNPLLHLFAEPHSLYSMSQSTTKIVSLHDNVWKYAHLQCRHAWSQITT